MSVAVPELSALGGEALGAALEARFDTETVHLIIGDTSLSILRPRNSDDLIREEDFVKDERLPYWADVWPSSIVLASHLVAIGQRSGPRRPGRALELGCGVGLVTIGALIAAYHVHATDYYTDALAFTRVNAIRNTGREPSTEMIDWRAFPPSAQGFDLILASDVLYEKEYAKLLPGIFKLALAPGGMALLADPGRIGVPVFEEECAKAGLVIRAKTTSPWSAEGISQQIDIYEIADRRS